MTRDNPVMALRFFKTTCFITRYFAEDSREFRSFVNYLKGRDYGVALSLLTKNHFPKRIKLDRDYDQLFLDFDTLGTRYD